jgi:Zn-finger nucleic acid-binding protein
VTEVAAGALQRCPRCSTGLEAEIVGAVAVQRCARCGGLWLDLETFRAICERDAGTAAERGAGAAGPGGGATGRSAPAGGAAGAATGGGRARQLPCPVCAELMNRVNFARVSGVVLDVCRQHGAWFDAGELRAVRSFVRGSGLGGPGRQRELAQDRERGGAAPGGGAATAAPADPLVALAVFPDRWDVPQARLPARQLALSAVLAAAGTALIWNAFWGAWRGGGSGFLAGVALLAVAAIPPVRALRSRAQRQDR